MLVRFDSKSIYNDAVICSLLINATGCQRRHCECTDLPSKTDSNSMDDVLKPNEGENAVCGPLLALYEVATANPDKGLLSGAF